MFILFQAKITSTTPRRFRSPSPGILLDFPESQADERSESLRTRMREEGLVNKTLTDEMNVLRLVSTGARFYIANKGSE